MEHLPINHIHHNADGVLDTGTSCCHGKDVRKVKDLDDVDHKTLLNVPAPNELDGIVLVEARSAGGDVIAHLLCLLPGVLTKLVETLDANKSIVRSLKKAIVDESEGKALAIDVDGKVADAKNTKIDGIKATTIMVKDSDA